MIDRHTTFSHHLFEIAVAHPVAAVPPHRPQNDVTGEMPTGEDTHGSDYFTPVFLLPQLCNNTLKVLTGQGAAIDTTSAQGKLVFGIFAALAEFERELISERTKAGLESARARGRKGGRPFKMTPAKVRLAMAAMGQPETSVAALCKELGITRQTLYRHVSPTGELREDGRKLLSGS
ncbi:DNA-invertase hin [Corynebacterium glutamicum]|nr:DNA-invertase hin [Corynebacterium glutamicum]